MMRASILMALFGAASCLAAQVIDNTDTRVQTTLDPGWKRIGTLRPKSVREIGSSRWTLGCETIDREYSDYHAFKEYLPALGIKRIRLQGGWARTEKDPGIYDFAWLDSIIDDARSRGLEILLETSYGNPAYPGGGGRTLGGGMPTSEDALEAWDRWVERMATRYKGKVRDWSMWNEPHLKGANSGDRITEFNIRTAEIIKRIIPDARIGALCLSSPRLEHIAPFVKTLIAREKLDLFAWVIYHHYAHNPDDRYDAVVKLRAWLDREAPRLKLWQGESGTQSEWCPSGALSKYPWTELKQAKWVARRMLGDIGRGSDSLVFTAADLDYRTTSFHNGLVRYGLIKTAGAVEDYRVLKVKVAYYAVQNVVSVFNDDLELIPDSPCELTCDAPVSVFGHKDVASGQQVCVFWASGAVPSDENAVVRAALTITGGTFEDPVWVDTITGGVYAIPEERVETADGRVVFQDIPVYDAPTFVTARHLLDIIPASH
ncbi:MAG: beta-galactosidase [Planctomycetes bacterium]|nr:beta-galactosidase [Planctomycetota bacterium]